MSPENKQSLISREYVMLTIVNFAMSMNMFTIMSTIPLYSLNVLELNERVAGIATGLFVAGMLLARLAAGGIAKRIGFRALMSIGVISMVVVSSGYFFVSGPLLLFAVRFLSGLAFGLVSNTNITIIASIIPRERSGEGMAYYTMGQVLSMAIGPFFGITLGGTGHFTEVFLIGTLLPAIAIPMLPFFRLGSVPVPAGHAGSFLDRFIDRRVLPIAGLTFLIFICNSSATSFIAVFAEQNDLIKAAGVFSLFNAGVIFVSRPFVSKLFDRKGAKIVVFPAIACVALGLLILMLAHNGVSLVLAAIPTGLGLGSVQSTFNAMIIHLVPKDRLSQASATLYIAFDSSAAIGPVVAGALIPLIGFRGLFGVALVMALICELLFGVVSGRIRPYQE
jgi:MFS family permease